MKGKKKKVALRRARVRERNARSNGPHSREEVLSKRRERYASRVHFSHPHTIIRSTCARARILKKSQG
jgi:hypothetical protein